MPSSKISTYQMQRKIYCLADVDTVLSGITNTYLVGSTKGLQVFNIPCSFDTEFSSFYEAGEKRGIMYIWMLGINGKVIVGRTWEEFISCINKISELLKLVAGKKHLIIYVHNLSAEFQFIRRRFNWHKVFAMDTRRPLYAVTTNGIEFRCSYLLSGYRLEDVGKRLVRYKVEKLVGDLDYSLVRHSKTPLTDKELDYCINDVLVVMAYIQECIEDEGDISKIPLTKTGYVRKFCREMCFHDGKPNTDIEYKIDKIKYRRMISRLRVTEDEYKQLKRAFQGGFTHASAWKAKKTYKNVRSYDFTSSYPAVMVSEQFPMSNPEEIVIHSIQELEENCKTYCCMFDVEFIELEERIPIEHPISSSRCYSLSIDTIIDNGRIVSSSHLITTLTEQDYFIVKAFYVWKAIRIRSFRRYVKTYLPTPFVKAILFLYKQKTELADIPGKETDYNKSKTMLNSAYGMSVTDIVRDEILYDDEWGIESGTNIEEQILKYNRNMGRFLYYPWGVWVTAYARHNLFTGIAEYRDDYLYSDTDSIKVLNYEKHLDYIQTYNKMIKEKLEAAMYYHGLPLDSVSPKGKTLGIWKDEGMYDNFKTLGAKRYLCSKHGELLLTVAGLNKTAAAPYLMELAGGDIDKAFSIFDTTLYFPPGKAGKLLVTYIDVETRGEVEDYLGVKAEYHELTSIHMEENDYSLSLSQSYADYLRRVAEHDAGYM